LTFLSRNFGFTLFYMKGTVPPSINMRHICRGIIPFVVLQITGLMLILAFPQIASRLPQWAGFLY